jgi:hypothetical protein
LLLDGLHSSRGKGDKPLAKIRTWQTIWKGTVNAWHLADLFLWRSGPIWSLPGRTRRLCQDERGDGRGHRLLKCQGRTVVDQTCERGLGLRGICKKAGWRKRRRKEESNFEKVLRGGGAFIIARPSTRGRASIATIGRGMLHAFLWQSRLAQRWEHLRRPINEVRKAVLKPRDRTLCIGLNKFVYHRLLFVLIAVRRIGGCQRKLWLEGPIAGAERTQLSCATDAWVC